MNENPEKPKPGESKRLELIDRRAQILSKLTPEEREELTNLEEEIRKLTTPNF